MTWHIHQRIRHPRPFGRSHNPPHRSHGNLVRTGYQGGRRCRAGRVAETRLEIVIRGPGPGSRLPRTRQRPPWGPRRAGKNTGGGEERSTAGRRKANDLAFRAMNARSHSGGLGRRHIFTLRGADPAPRFPTFIQRPDRKRGVATEKLVLNGPHPATTLARLCRLEVEGFLARSRASCAFAAVSHSCGTPQLRIRSDVRCR